MQRIRHAFVLFVLIVGMSTNAPPTGAAPGGKHGGSDVSKNALVTDSSATPVIIGEVVGVYSTGVSTEEKDAKGFYVLLDPSTVAFNPMPSPSAMVVVTGEAGKEIQSTDEQVFFGDTGCTGTPFFVNPSRMFARTFVSHSGDYTFWVLPTTQTGLTNVPYFYRWTRSSGCNSATGVLSIAYPATSSYTLPSSGLSLPFKVVNP